MIGALDALSDLTGFSAAVLLRATVLLVGALSLSTLLTGASAAARHAFWTITAGALLLLPWLPAALPTVPIPWPSAVIEWARPLSGGRSEPASGEGAVHPGGIGEAVSAPTGFAEVEERRSPESFSAGVIRESSATSVSVREVVVILLLLLWIVGSVAATAALGVGLFRVQRLARDARPVDDSGWRESLDRARRRVGIRGAVEVRSTPAAPIPLAGGLTRPFVLIPTSAESWSAERRELVLTHELVHVARHDALRQVVSRLATALYWFHPLAHVAARKALLAREQACDEAVIALGNRPSLYARHLLELAEPARVPLPVLSLIERPQLEERLMAILKPGRRSGRGVTVAAASCAAVWALTVAASSPASAPDGAALVAISTWDAAALAAEPTPSLLPAPGSASSTGPVPAPASVPRALPQERSCWSDAPGESFVGYSFSYTEPDSTPAIERYGWIGEDRVIQTRSRGTMVCMRAHGAVTFADDGERIAAMANGAWIVMGSRDQGRTMDLVVTSEPSGPEYAWYVDGSRRDFGPEAMQWRDAMVPLLAAYWDVAAAGRAREALGEASRVMRENREALELAQREATLARARVTEEMLREREGTERELVAAARVVDSLNATRDERILENRRQIEAVQRELAAVAQLRTRALRAATPETDSVRAIVERSRAEMETLARARVADEALARAEVARARTELGQLTARQRTELARMANELTAAARRDGSADPAAFERRLAEIQQQLVEQVRRLQEAMRRIP